MKKVRIISNGKWFKVQVRVFLFFWKTEQRPEDLDNKDFGGDACFYNKKEAEDYIEKKLKKESWEVVK